MTSRKYVTLADLLLSSHHRGLLLSGFSFVLVVLLSVPSFFKSLLVYRSPRTEPTFSDFSVRLILSDLLQIFAGVISTSRNIKVMQVPKRSKDKGDTKLTNEE